MITVFVLIAARPGVTTDVIAQLRNISGVKRVYEVMGPYDILLEIEVASIGDIPLVLGADIRTIKGIQSTTSLVALPDPSDTGS
jgi:DNA-binding Lrp family transcriptional regulator